MLALLSVLALGASALPDNEQSATLAAKAQAILKTHCYRCHGQDGAVEGGLNYVLDLKTLVSRKKIIPGQPDKSRLFKRVSSDDNPMPPLEETSRPSKDDIALLRQWIEAGAPDVQQSSARRGIIKDADIVQLIHDDLRGLNERQRPYTRYFTISHLYNLNLAEDELQTYRHGLSKLVNSLSWEPDIVAPRPIDPARTIFRIDLRDYRWNAQVWNKLVESCPYGIVYGHSMARAVYAATQCELPYLRADWFVFAASRPPLYHDVLQLPKTDRELEQDLKVDVSANIREERMARAGFNGSGVSRNNRLIERHKTGFGAYWKSYDFAGNIGRQNLFAHPFGPGSEPDTFQQDGGEIIFSLPNGLHAYLLVDGKGNRIDEGPTKIVSVKNKPDPTVINGVSCMFCHARGMIDKTDQIRAHVEKNPSAFTETEAQLVRALYPPEGEFKELLRKDAERYLRAVTATGAKSGQMEPIVALAGRFEAELDLAMAATELGLAPEILVRALDQHPEFGQKLGAFKAAGGTVQRQVFVEAFADMVQTLRLGIALPAFNRAVAAATETIRRQPRDATAYKERGNLYMERGDLEHAVRDFTDAIERDFRGSAVYENRGMAYANQGEFDKALADYTEALRRDPSNAQTYHNRGLAFARAGQLDRALADFSEGVRLEPANALLRSDRGLALFRKGDPAQAIADFSESLRLDPQSALTLVRRGDAYRLQEEDDKATADYSRALELSPQFRAAHRGRALAQERRRNYGQALADAAVLVRLDPGSAAAHNGLAWLQATVPEPSLRNGTSAVEHATRACELTDWKEPEFLDTLAAAHAECGRFEEACRWANKALALAPDKDKAAFQSRLALYQARKPFRLPSSSR